MADQSPGRVDKLDSFFLTSQLDKININKQSNIFIQLEV